MKNVFILSLVFPLFTFAADPETLVFSFQKQKNPDEIQATAKMVGDYLTTKLGKKVEVLVPTSYGTTAQGLISKKVHVAYMDSLPYLLASNETDLEIAVVERRKERTEYDSLVVVAKNSPIKSFADLKGNAFWLFRFFKTYVSFKQILIMCTVAQILMHGFNFAEINVFTFWVAPSLLSSLQLFYFGTYLPHRKINAVRFADHHHARNSNTGFISSLISCYHFGTHHLTHHKQPGVPWYRLPKNSSATL